jgi:hypothetical protein
MAIPVKTAPVKNRKAPQLTVSGCATDVCIKGYPHGHDYVRATDSKGLSKVTNVRAR